MIDERWRRIDEVLAVALELGESERDAWLGESCKGDSELRRAVERLLALESDADDFLSASVDLDVALGSPSTSFHQGARIGRYRIERLLGQGGMGQVYLGARADQQFEMRVAIKVLSGPGTPSLLRRFRTERQILAGFEHPAITRLIDGGITSDGRLYLVLEYVDGVPIDRYCHQTQLTLGQRLSLFLDVCSAVSYAHQQLIVHRDLKPANILVTADAAPKLLDFGIAKVLDTSRFPHDPVETQVHQRLLTLQYASPEQVKGEAIGTATDVYGLGLLLFEMVTGQHPLPVDGLSTREAERKICDHDPPTASSTLARQGADGSLIRPRQLSGDLDTILAKSLAKEPDHRYRSVRHLAEDVERHLDRRPILARRGGWFYRGSRFLRRYAMTVAVMATIFLVLLGFVVISATHARQLARERDEAEAARERAERVSSYMNDVFRHASPEQSRGSPPTARELLAQGASDVLAQLDDEPEVQTALMLTMADAYAALGDHRAAIDLLESGRRTLQRLHGPTHPEVAKASIMLGPLWIWLDDLDRAEAFLREAVALREQAYGRHHPLTLEALFEFARLRGIQGRIEHARHLYLRILETRLETLGPAHLQTLETQHQLATVLIQLGEHDEAVRLLSAALPGLRRELGEDHPNIAIVLHNLGSLVDDPERAKDLLTQALELRRRLYDADDPRTAKTMSNLVLTYVELNDPRAIVLAEEALIVRRRRLGDQHPQLSHALANLAEALYSAGRVEEAVSKYRESIDHAERTLAADHPSVAFPIARLGNLFREIGRDREAEPYLRRAFEIRQAALKKDAPVLLESLDDLEECLRELGKDREADQLVESVTGG